MTATLPALPPVPEEAEDLACDHPYGPLQAAQPIMFAEALEWAVEHLALPDAYHIHSAEVCARDCGGLHLAAIRLRSLARQLREGTP